METKKAVKKPVTKKEVKSVKKTTKLVIESKKSKKVKSEKDSIKKIKKEKPNLKDSLALAALLGGCLLGLLYVMSDSVKANKVKAKIKNAKPKSKSNNNKR